MKDKKRVCYSATKILILFFVVVSIGEKILTFFLLNSHSNIVMEVNPFVNSLMSSVGVGGSVVLGISFIFIGSAIIFHLNEKFKHHHIFPYSTFGVALFMCVYHSYFFINNLVWAVAYGLTT